MARIIQDSDDEFDEEDLEEKEAEPAPAPPVEDASSKQLDHTSQHGTGSTGTSSIYSISKSKHWLISRSQNL